MPSDKIAISNNRGLQLEQWYAEYNTLLCAAAYRMLGTAGDAADTVQDVFTELAAKPKLTLTLANPKAYLIRAVINRCLNRLKSAAVHRLQYVGPWLPEPLLDLDNDMNNSSSSPLQSLLREEQVTYALLVALQLLTPTERAVYLLRETLQYSFNEIAQLLARQEAGCRQLYHRARKRLHASGSLQAASSDSKNELRPSAEALAKQFLLAAQTGDFTAFISRLAEDASLLSDSGGKVRAAMLPILGRERILALLQGIAAKGFFAGELSLLSSASSVGVLLSVNKQPKCAFFWNEPTSGRLQATEMYMVLNPDKLSGSCHE